MMAIPTITPAPTVQSLQRREDAVLPLTTIFTPPNECFTAPFTVDNRNATVAWRDYFQLSSSCYPPSFSSLQNNWNWYSPGVCASGYSMAQSRSWSTNSEMLTQAWCCPQDFTISGSSLSGQDYQYCTSTASDASAAWVNDDSTLLVSLPTFTALQWPMSVQWASTDLSKFSPASAPILMASATTVYSLPSDAAIGTTSAAPSPTATIARTSQAASLSTGAKAGIGVGAGLLVIAVSTLLALMMFRRRKARRSAVNKVSPSTSTEEERPFAGGHAKLAIDRFAVGPQRPVEMEAVGHLPQEMEARESKHPSSSPVELAGDVQRFEASAEAPLKDKADAK